MFYAQQDETSQHLFFNCQFSRDVWSKCYQWAGIQITYHEERSSKKLHAIFYPRGESQDISMLEGVLVCSGIYGVFGFSETIDVEKTIELIKMTSWMWLTAKDKTFSSSWIAWATDPVLCKKGNLL
ncbi:hypothetical protein GYH30_018114 [Glycine max]|nr:hypothetical protein GYH30_018114 [Glycine max]